MADLAPNVVIVGGPNGSGKTTTTPELVRDRLAIRGYVNADGIAQGQSAFNAETVALQAGRLRAVTGPCPEGAVTVFQ